MSTSDYFLRNKALTQSDLAISKSRALAINKEINIIDPAVDESWRKLDVDPGMRDAYFDYFYSGQDIKCYVAEVDETDTEFGVLPILAVGYNVKQEKMPVYGYWSNTFDGVMRGNRVINGQMVLATRYPNYMKNLLARAANNRSQRGKSLAENYPARNLTADDQNIKDFWDQHFDAGTVGQNTTVWSTHPPFNFVIVYGIQDTSVTGNDLSRQFTSGGTTAIFTDHNQRLVEAYNSNQPNKIVLEACEFTSLQRSYAGDGTVLTETYEFFARDEIVPPSFYRKPQGGS